jgi:DNA-binding SARP family transcriptional activator
LVELAPYWESAHALRMQALVASGNPAEALRSYDCLRRGLREELGASPGADLQELYQRLLTLTAGTG